MWTKAELEREISEFLNSFDLPNNSEFESEVQTASYEEITHFIDPTNRNIIWSTIEKKETREVGVQTGPWCPLYSIPTVGDFPHFFQPQQMGGPIDQPLPPMQGGLPMGLPLPPINLMLPNLDQPPWQGQLIDPDDYSSDENNGEHGMPPWYPPPPITPSTASSDSGNEEPPLLDPDEIEFLLSQLNS